MADFPTTTVRELRGEHAKLAHDQRATDRILDSSAVRLHPADRRVGLFDPLRAQLQPALHARVFAGVSIEYRRVTDSGIEDKPRQLRRNAQISVEVDWGALMHQV